MIADILSTLTGQVVILELDPGGSNWVQATLSGTPTGGFSIYNTARNDVSVCVQLDVSRIKSIRVERLYNSPETQVIITLHYPEGPDENRFFSRG